MRVSFASLVTLFAVLFLASSTYAAVSVQGKIKKSNGSTNGSGAAVSVTCNGTTIPTTAASNGNFGVEFTDEQCPDGSTVTVNASLDGETGSDSQSAASNTNFGNIVLAAIAVPEFGLITGIVAAGGSALAYMKMKKGMA